MVGPDSLRVAVIVPAYQAAKTISGVLAGIPVWVDLICVVDDGSSDDTASAVLAVRDDRVHLLRHEANRGVGAAMATGYLHALRQDMDICIKMDADGQMDPRYLPDLIEPLVAGRADYAKGNRFHHVRALRQMPRARKVGTAALSFLIKAASGQWHIFDPTNGYTAVHRAALSALELDIVHPRYFFESSMLILLQRIGAVAEDVLMPARYGREASHLTIGRSLLEFPGLLIRYGMRRIFHQYFLVDFTPVSLFLLSGTLLFAGGSLFGVYHWIDSYRRHVITPTGTVMLAALPVILGFQLLLQAIVLDIQNVPRRPLQARNRMRSVISTCRVDRADGTAPDEVGTS